MSKISSFSLLCTLLLFTILPVHAFREQGFKNLNMKDELAGCSVYSICKDRDGFIWFGTRGGLIRYDGKNTRNFTSDKYRLNIKQMYDTSDGMLLLLAGSSLLCFDRYHECFVDISGLNGQSYYETRGLVPRNDSTYWSITGNKLQLLKREALKKTETKKWVCPFRLLKESVLADDKEVFHTICESQDKKKLFLTTQSCKLLTFDVQTEKLEATKPLPTGMSDSYSVSSTFCDRNYLWIATIGGGVLRYHLQSHSFDFFSRYSKEGRTLSHDDVYAFIAVGDKYIAATWNGYTVFSSGKKTDDVRTEVNGGLANLSHNPGSRMLSAYYDPEGLVYFGTHGGEVIILDLREQFYERFSQSETNEICDIVSDNRGYVWLATFSGAIMCSDTPFEQTETLNFTMKNEPFVPGKAALCTVKDEDGNLWFGHSDASISCRQAASGEFVEYSLPIEHGQNSSMKNAAYVWQLFIDSKHRLWVGMQNGLLLFDRATKSFSPVSTVDGELLKGFSVRAITEGRNGELWLGGSDGLRKLVMATNGEVTVNGDYEIDAGISDRYVRALFSSKDGQLYIGYTDGLGILAQDKDSVQHFCTTRDGICSNFVTCIAEDEKGDIWLGTNSGISRYSRRQNLFYNYYISGSNRSVMRMGNTLFFGNNYALTYFSPDVLTGVSPIKKNMLLDLEVNNKRVMIGEKINEQVVLHKGLPYTEELILNYTNRDFSLSFSNLLYSEEHQKYKYRLLPYQNKWIVCGGGDKAVYTNLPAGNYVFEVKSISLDGTDSAVKTLSIQILPHWSQTVWFRLCLLLIAVLMTCYGVYWIYRRKHLKRIYTKSLILGQAGLEAGKDEFMQKVINVIEANLTNGDFNAQMLADQLEMSQSTLYRKIKERRNLSITKVIRSVRISKAASLIMEHKYSIVEISEMVGFNDLNTFRKHFMEQFGVLPSKYDERKPTRTTDDCSAGEF